MKPTVLKEVEACVMYRSRREGRLGGLVELSALRGACLFWGGVMRKVTLMSGKAGVESGRDGRRGVALRKKHIGAGYSLSPPALYRPFPRLPACGMPHQGVLGEAENTRRKRKRSAGTPHEPKPVFGCGLDIYSHSPAPLLPRPVKSFFWPIYFLRSPISARNIETVICSSMYPFRLPIRYGTALLYPDIPRVTT